MTPNTIFCTLPTHLDEIEQEFVDVSQDFEETRKFHRNDCATFSARD
jgi:hypothetical protein